MTEFIKCDEGNLKVEAASNYANCILTNIVFVLSKADWSIDLEYHNLILVSCIQQSII